jgi:carotenoid cleavage dioxygenase-like enzyme
MSKAPQFGATYVPLGAEVDVRDCEVEGRIPANLSGGFYAVGPDPMYPLAPGNIPFDGDGHVRLFRFRNGRVDYRSRYVRTERYVAQDKARRNLMPMYRNPLLDDASVQGLSRSTANTHVIQHRHLLLALKEDSPPSALDLETRLHVRWPVAARSAVHRASEGVLVHRQHRRLRLRSARFR